MTLSAQAVRSAETISLAGTWRFAADSESEGVRKTLWKTTLPDTVRLPGSTAENEKGPLNDQRPTHGWSPVRQPLGAAWYQRDVEIPAAWAGRHITLTLGRTKRTRVWIDDREAGSQSGICAPQVFDLSDRLPAGKHTLTILVTTGPFPKGIGGHHLGGLQGNWNGIIGAIELAAAGPVWIDAVRVTPDVATKTARVRVTLGNVSSTPARGQIVLEAKSWNGPTTHVPPPKTVAFTAAGPATTLAIDYPLGDGMLLWDEFTPALYRLAVSLGGERREVDFGMREFTRRGTQFAVNGRAVFLRGTHDAGHFPLTGYPAMETADWLRMFRIMKSYGINHYRFHTWCPPEAALAAADVAGIYMQPELPSHSGFAFGESEAHDAFCREEGQRILASFGNHPSFVMLALGNEIGIHRPENRRAMTAMVSHFRRLDPSRLYAEGSNNNFGDPLVNPNDDYFTTFRTQRRAGPVRGSFATVDKPLGHVQAGPPGTMADYRQSIAGIRVPVIGHEVGQYTVYPNFREMAKYTGVLRLRNYEVFRESLQARGMLDQADDFVRASGALAVLCYREEIEAALRTPGFGGFQLLDMVDYQGQGTAVVGILDSFSDSKGLIEPAAWREFCSASVPLVRMTRYAWTADETFTAEAEVAHYGPAALAKVAPQWSLRDAEGREIRHGAIPATDIPQGTLVRLGTIRTSLAGCAAPQKLTLELRLPGTTCVNHYPLWVYSAKVDTATPPGVTIARACDRAMLDRLAAGGTVVCFPSPGKLRNSVEGGFATDFWCWPMFHNTPGTMGLLCDPRHPAMAGFPTESHSNWQWFHVAVAAAPIVLDDAPAGFRPLVQVIDNLARNHRLGLVFEARVGRGRLLVCAADLPAMTDKPEARQLLASLLRYAGSAAFQPEQGLSPEQVKGILAEKP